MNFFELSLLALALSMDAFAVAVTVGLSMPKPSIKNALIVGLYFGGFQAGMPIIGYFVAIRFSGHVMAYNHWIVFGLLVFLGGKMILGSLKKEGCPDRECPAAECKDRECPLGHRETSLGPTKMLPLALATSIDAMAVGVSFAFMQVNVWMAVTFIGVATLLISMTGVKIGNIVGSKFKSKANLAGGVILVLMGVRVLVESLI